MKLASLKQGRDGKLVVVSDDLAWYADAGHIAPTLQAALDDWDRVAPELEMLVDRSRPRGDPAGALPRARRRRRRCRARTSGRTARRT